MDVNISPYALGDVEELFRVVSESADHLRPWMPWLQASYSQTDTQTWVEQCIQDWGEGIAYRYVVRASHSGRIIGCVGLERVIHAHKIAELGYWIASSAIHHGAATEAGKLAVYEAFTTHGLQRIEINVLKDNAPSNKVALNVGGFFEGSFRNKLFHNGRSHPANSYSIVPEDY